MATVKKVLTASEKVALKAANAKKALAASKAAITVINAAITANETVTLGKLGVAYPNVIKVLYTLANTAKVRVNTRFTISPFLAASAGVVNAYIGTLNANDLNLLVTGLNSTAFTVSPKGSAGILAYAFINAFYNTVTASGNASAFKPIPVKKVAAS